MKRLLIYIYALVTLLLASCTGGRYQQVAHLLKEADSLMDQHPDSVLHLLEARQADKDAWPRSQRMRWELLRAKAMNKAYVPFTTDSVMLQVASYYDGGDPNDAILAHYLLGCVYRDLGEAPRAIDSYQEAISKSEKSVNDKSTYRTLSSIYSQMANVYHRQLLLTNEIDARKKAYHYAESVGLTKIALYERKMSANAYSLLNERDTAEILLKEVLHLYEENDYIQDGLQSSILLMHLYVEQQEHLDELEKLIKRFDSESNLFDENHELKSRYRYYYYYKGRYFESIDLLDSADYYYRKVQYPNMSFVAHNSMYKGLLSVYAKRHVADSIAKYAQLYCMANDSSIAKKDMELTAQMEASYNYSRHQQMALKQTAKVRTAHLMLTAAVSLLMILALAFLAYYWRSRARKNQFEKRLLEYQQMLERRQAPSPQTQNDAVAERPNTLLESKLRKALIDRIEKGGSGTVKATDEEWLQMEEEVNHAYPAFNERLAHYLPHLNPVHFKICLGIKFGLEPGQIAVLVSRSKQTVSNARSRMYRKAFGIDGTTVDFDQFIDSF